MDCNVPIIILGRAKAETPFAVLAYGFLPYEFVMIA